MGRRVFIEMGYTLGLDIGITSVGFGVIDVENQKIIESGVRLFSEGKSEATKERRELRGNRRSIRRKAHRLSRVRKLLEENGFFMGDTSTSSPYASRCKGLTQKLEREELYASLYQLAKHRGISFLEDIEGDSSNENDYLKSIKINEDLLKDKYPCEIQLDRLRVYGKTRGNVQVVDEETGEHLVLMNVFPAEAYKKEAMAILTTQKTYYPEITDKFIEKYKELLSQKRKYYEGPGNEKSRTDYGIYRENGETWTDLFENLIGECSLCEGAQRASKFSKTAQKYNLLNDLNNLSFNGNKLTTAQKEEIYHLLIQPKKTIQPLNVLAKIAGCKKEEFEGCRKDAKGKPEIHSMKDYRQFRYYLLETTGFDIETLDDAVFDEMAKWLTLNGTPSVIRSMIDEKLKLELDESVVDEIINFRKKNTNMFSGWHSYSIQGIDLLLDELWETTENQMQIISRLNLGGTRKIEYKGKKLPVSAIVSNIKNPVVRTSVRESLKIVNEMMNRYKKLDHVVIEMARESNSIEEKKRIKDAQNQAVKMKKKVMEAAKKEFCFSDEVYRSQANFNTKLRLWYEQSGKCVYSGKDISVKDLVFNPHLFQIDHIIPKSISFDDSLTNKVLCYASENQNKGQRSPRAYFKTTYATRSYEAFKQEVLFLNNEGKGLLPTAKKELLLLEEDLNKYETRQAFKNRNLVDTRYSSRYVLNTLQDFFAANKRETKVSVVRGKFTANLRRRWGINKDRDEGFSHHALDALIIASVPHLKLFNNTQVLSQENSLLIDENTGELLKPLESNAYDRQAFLAPFESFIDQLCESEVTCKFSHKEDSKVNRAIANQTVYAVHQNVKLKKCKVNGDSFELDSSTGETYVIRKIDNIYEDLSVTGSKKENTFMKQYKKNKTAFLMYHYDKQTFEQLENALAPYALHENPLLAYYQEHGPFRKYSRKGEGTMIYSMKFLEKKLNSCLEVSNKTDGCRSGVMLSLKPWRTDVYFNRETKRYVFVGMKHADMRFQKGRGDYGISLEDYQVIQRQFGIEMSLQDIQSYMTDKTYNSNSSPFIFCFSLYKNNYFSLQSVTSERPEVVRLLSTNIDGTIKYKPIFKEETESKLSPSKIKKMIKYNVSVTGERFEVYREKLKLNFE